VEASPSEPPTESRLLARPGEFFRSSRRAVIINNYQQEFIYNKYARIAQNLGFALSVNLG
jgi:hypothetical protein